MELLSDTAGYGFFCDPALDLWNIALLLLLFNSTDKPVCSWEQMFVYLVKHTHLTENVEDT